MTRISGIVEELRDRIRGAEADERDHKKASLSVCRELAGYTKGLRDALFVVEYAARPKVLGDPLRGVHLGQRK